MVLPALITLGILLAGAGGAPSGRIVKLALKEKPKIPVSKEPIVIKGPLITHIEKPVLTPKIPFIEEARAEAAKVIAETPTLLETLTKPVEELRPEETAAILTIPAGAEVTGFATGLLGGTGITEPTPVIFPTYNPPTVTDPSQVPVGRTWVFKRVNGVLVKFVV